MIAYKLVRKLKNGTLQTGLIEVSDFKGKRIITTYGDVEHLGSATHFFNVENVMDSIREKQ